MHGCTHARVFGTACVGSSEDNAPTSALSLQGPKDQVQAVRLVRQYFDEPSHLLDFDFSFSQSQAVSSAERTLLARAQMTLQRDTCIPIASVLISKASNGLSMGGDSVS